MSTPKTRWIVTHVRDVAEFFGRTRRTVDQWLSQGCPGSPDRYDLSGIAVWLLERGHETT